MNKNNKHCLIIRVQTLFLAMAMSYVTFQVLFTLVVWMYVLVYSLFAIAIVWDILDRGARQRELSTLFPVDATLIVVQDFRRPQVKR